MLTELDARPGLHDGSQPVLLGPRPRPLDRIDYRVYTNQEAMIQALKNGEIDVADGLQALADQLGRGHDPNITLQKVVSDWWLNLAFNFGGQPGPTTPAAGPARPRRPHRDRDGDRQERDRQEGVRGSRDAGRHDRAAGVGVLASRYPGRSGVRRTTRREPTTCSTTPATSIRTTTGSARTRAPASRSRSICRLRTDTTGAEEAGELIVGYLKQIGIKVDLLPATDAKMNDYWGSGNFDAYIWYWSGDPDPNYQLFVFTSEQCGSWSDGCWKDPHFDKLYEEQRTMMDQTQRQADRQEGAAVRVRPGAGRRARVSQLARGLPQRPVHGWVGQPGPGGYLLPDLQLRHLAVAASDRRDHVQRLEQRAWVGMARRGCRVVGIVLVVMRRGRKIEPDEA